MKRTKPRNAFVAPEGGFTDLGVLNMTPASMSNQIEPETEPGTPNSDVAEESSVVRFEVMEPKNWVRNRVIVRNS